MATYVIGDIQGCYYSFLKLLKKINFTPRKDNLWLVGDLINRGNGSLQVLRWCYKHKSSVKAILGNHDLHALAAKYNIIPLDNDDTLDKLFKAKDSEKLFDWLRSLPLAHYEKKHLMVHAGVLPNWNLKDILQLSREVSKSLLGKKYITLLKNMYGNEPSQWSNTLTKNHRLRVVINTLTRLRALKKNGAIDFSYKGELKTMPKNLIPWFEHPKRRTKKTPIIFGHWSALGLVVKDNIFAIDTGCVWGRSLTAIELESKHIFSVKTDKKDI
ncbi:MAG: symmetrical bis(5'-nucleosyl)-tetraphosphatase [Candidatus Methylopumilus sp.]|nr:symmetrical bis(5'-nucleosyl)-tetraphosphatase [Candidatus Methylopumilus sp.]